MIAFHGTADTVVPFNGGLGSGVSGTTNFRLPIDTTAPVENVIGDWSAHNGCTSGRQESQVSTEVRLVQYGACTGGAIVQLYAVDGGGHTWPGTFSVPSLGYTTRQISATDLSWAFFAAHPLNTGSATPTATPQPSTTTIATSTNTATAQAAGNAVGGITNLQIGDAQRSGVASERPDGSGSALWPIVIGLVAGAVLTTTSGGLYLMRQRR